MSRLVNSVFACLNTGLSFQCAVPASAITVLAGYNWGRAPQRIDLHGLSGSQWIYSALCSAEKQSNSLKRKHRSRVMTRSALCTSIGQWNEVTDSDQTAKGSAHLSDFFNDRRWLAVVGLTTINTNFPIERNLPLNSTQILGKKNLAYSQAKVRASSVNW